MTSKQFKVIARLLKEIYKQLEEDALKSGVSPLSDEYKMVQDKARLAVLEKSGFTLDEYRKIKEEVAGISPTDMVSLAEELKSVKKQVEDIKIPTKEEISDIAFSIAKEFIVPPQITNEIVKEITVKEPITVKETVKVTERVEYDDERLQERLSKLSKKIDEIKIPKEIDPKKLEDHLTSKFGEMLEHNIN